MGQKLGRWVLSKLPPPPLINEACAACRSTLKIGLGLFGGKYRTKISIPSLCSHLSEMDSTLVVKWCICD